MTSKQFVLIKEGYRDYQKMVNQLGKGNPRPAFDQFKLRQQLAQLEFEEKNKPSIIEQMSGYMATIDDAHLKITALINKLPNKQLPK